MQRDWWSDAHLGALSGCDVKDNSGEPVPWTGQAQMLVGNEAGAVGMEDSGGEVYEAKSAGLGLWTGQPILPLEPPEGLVSLPHLGRCFYPPLPLKPGR